jgi:F0F1-type ATP synthase membrane subunit b/b'
VIFKQIVVPYINFIVFGILFVVFFRKQLVNAVLKKRESFQLLFKDASEQKKQIEEKYSQLQRQYEGLELEIYKLKQSALESAEKEASNLVSEAKRLAEVMKVEAERTVAFELQNAKQQLRQNLLNDVKAEIEKKLTGRMSSETQTNFIKQQTKELHSLKIEA